VLALLYSHPDEEFYLRQMVRAIGTGLGATQREVKTLTDAGIIRRRVRGRQIYYQANPDCPIFSELRGMVVKTAGVADVLRTALAPLADRIEIAFIYGSVARGKERRGSDVDVLVVGDVTFAEVTATLGQAQEILKREVNPTVYPVAEFKSKLAANHHFIKSVMKEARIVLIGDERELARMAKKRLARRT
jgi:predicted nucleotidyltransferase